MRVEHPESDGEAQDRPSRPTPRSAVRVSRPFLRLRLVPFEQRLTCHGTTFSVGNQRVRSSTSHKRSGYSTLCLLLTPYSLSQGQRHRGREATQLKLAGTRITIRSLYITGQSRGHNSPPILFLFTRWPPMLNYQPDSDLFFGFLQFGDTVRIN